MGPVHSWAQGCSLLIFVGVVLALGSTTAIGDKSETHYAFDYDQLKQIRELVVEPLTFTQFTEPSASPMEVGFNSENLVEGIAELLLVVIKYNGENASEQSWVRTSDTVDSIAAGKEVIHNFPTDIPSLPEIKDGDDVTLVVIAHDKDTNPLAAGEFKFTYRSTIATLDWVGAANDDSSAFLRVGSVSSVTIGEKCKCDGNQPCYCKQEDVPESNPKLCVQVSGTGNGGIELNPFQCNEHVTPLPFVGISTIQSAELHTKADDSREFEISATYADTSKTTQVLFYKEGDEPSDSKDCTDITHPCTAVPPGDTTFNILLVALDDQSAVVESQFIAFEDYLVIAKKLTADALEVSWTDSTSTFASRSARLESTTEYEVLIDDESDAFAKTEGNKCADDSCKAYFVKIQAGTIKCTVHIKGNEMIKTSRSLDMTKGPTPNQAKFTYINKQDSDTTTIQIQPDSAINSVDEVSLVVITLSGEDGSENIYEGTTAMAREDSKYQFDVTLPSSVDTYFVLVGHDANGDITMAGTAKGLINVFNTNLAWVGGDPGSDEATLRISTTDDEVTFLDSSCSCTTLKSPCYCVHTDLEENDIVVCSHLEDDVQYCDMSIGVTSFADISNIKISRLVYPLSGDPFYEFQVDNEDAAKYELLILRDDNNHDTDSIKSCEGSVCNITLSSPPEKAATYSVLAVAITNVDAVLQSKEFLFEDSKVIVEKLLDDLLWVKWTPAEDFTYSIDCMPETSGYPDPSKTSQRCDGTDVACMVIFADLKCDNKDGIYTGEVTKNDNKVAGQVLMDCSGYATDVQISRLVQERRSSGSSTMSVCFTTEELNSTDISSLNLMMHNQEGLIYQAQDPKQGEAEGEFCFASLKLDVESMDLNQPLTLIVHPTKQARAELYLLDVTLNQVKENTLKTNWKSKNNPTNYTIMFDDQITGVDNKECLQYGDCEQYLHMEEGQKETRKSITIIEEGAVIQELHLEIPEYTRTDSES